ncbi:hypothetical protein K458DRAFT_383924 [Lentithecium fluviatile CBS 122367]|uniref:Uncharacterized protein n=1 Tax=Lentithecium fluviatile CBS 122367 TaxID=1168545 RepID=A0A6G1JFM1_9PLEO|nr:hypothetical protein K458DRAFT_383924 [Lentithecium fluviatile CBS 122367]
MAPPNLIPWATVFVGGAALLTLAYEVLTSASSSSHASQTPSIDIDTKEYEWDPPLQSQPKHQSKHADILLTSTQQKAQSIYPSIPAAYLTITTKRHQMSPKPCATDPWTAAIFHTGWDARCILASCHHQSREAALEALGELLDTRSVGGYEWMEIVGADSDGSKEAGLATEIKRLACNLHKTTTPSTLAVAVKRHRIPNRSDPWTASLWARPHEGLADETLSVCARTGG